MSIINPRSWFSKSEAPPEQKASAAGQIMAQHVVGTPVWTPRNYEALARESYMRNAISYRCVKMIATACANVSILLQSRGVEIDEHPLLDLLDRPNPMVGGSYLMEAFYTHLLLSGNGYLEAVGPNGKPPSELWALRSDRMKIIPGSYGMPMAFEYELSGGRKRWPVDPLTGKSDVMHLREFHPLDDWYGMSRVEAAAYAIDRHNSASAHNKALLENGARPSGALVFEPIPTPGIDGVIHAPPSAIEAAEKDLASRHAGAINAGRPMVLGGKVQWLEMGLSPRDMDFGEGKDDAARDICTAWGVPFTLLVKGQSTYNNVSEAKLELVEETVIPLVETGLDSLNNWLTPRFGDRFKLVADLDSISALEPRRTARRTSVTELLKDGVIDDDEAREMLRYGPRKPEAVKKVDASVLTALLGTTETVGMEPLVRYMRSVGLFSPGKTDAQILNDALALVEDEDEGDDDATAVDDADPNEKDESDV